MNKLVKLYYQLTAYVPRSLPKNAEEFEKFRNVIINAYGVADDSKSWATICGHIASVPSYTLRKSYGKLANSAKRLIVNEIAHTFKAQAMNALKKQLEDAFEKYKLENPEQFKETSKEEPTAQIMPQIIN